VAIGNADSGEALIEGLQYEASAFLQFEVHPLADFNWVIRRERGDEEAEFVTSAGGTPDRAWAL